MQRIPKGGFEVTVPTCPPIFIAHLPSSGLNAAQEIFFGYKIKLEGIHIVPNLASPGFPFVGRTKPDLSKGPFALELFGRNCLTNEIVNYLAVNIHGGVPWMPVLKELRDMEIDYLACSGSYEEVTIIFHGVIIGPSSSEGNSEKSLPPYPNSLQHLSFNGDMKEKANNKGLKGKVLTPLLPPLTVDEAPETLRQNIIRNITPAGKTFSASFKSKVLSSRSYVSFPIEPCASIVERGFEINLETAFQTPEAVQNYLQTFADLLKACYNGKDDLHMEKSEMHNLLEEETVAVLSAVLTHGLQLFYGHMSHIDVEQEKFVELGGLVMRYARLLLANETTNNILRENGTWASLLSLVRVLLSLPPSIMQSYLNLILDGCCFLSLLNEFISPTISGSSPYQDLIILSLQLPPTDTLSTTLVTQILGQIAVYEHIQNFVSCAEESLSPMELVAQKINWRHAAYEKIASDEAADEVTDAFSRSNEEKIREQHEFDEAVLSSFEPVNQLVKQTQALLTVWKHFNEVKTRTINGQEKLVDDEDAIVQFMEKNDFFPAIAALIHVSAVAHEMKQVIDDSLPQYQKIITIINELQKVLLDMYLMLQSLKCYEAMIIQYGEVLLSPLSSSPCSNGVIKTWKEEIQVILSLSWSSLQFLKLSKNVINDEDCDLEAMLTHWTLLINGLSLPQTQVIAHQLLEKYLLNDMTLLLEKLLHIESELLSVDLRLGHDMLVAVSEKLLSLKWSEIKTKQVYEVMGTACQMLKQKDTERSRDLPVDQDNEDNAIVNDAKQASSNEQSAEIYPILAKALQRTSSNQFDNSSDTLELYDHQLSEAVKPLIIKMKVTHLISKQQGKQYQGLLLQLSKTINSRQQQLNNKDCFFRALSAECRLQLIRHVVTRTLNMSLMTLNLAIATVFLSTPSFALTIAMDREDLKINEKDRNLLLSAMKTIDDVQMIVGNSIDLMLASINLLDCIELSHLPHEVVTSLIRVLIDATIGLSQPAVIAVDQVALQSKATEFKAKVAKFLAQAFTLHEVICAEVHKIIQQALPDERAPLLQLLSTIIRKVDGESRDFPQILLTYFPHEGAAETTKSLAKFVIESLFSQAADVQEAVLQFILAITLKCSVDACAFVYYELVIFVQCFSTRYLQTVNAESTSNNNGKAILQSMLIRSFMLIEQLLLADNSVPMLLLLQQGVLHVLFLLVHGEGNVSLVAQQCLWTAHGKLEALSRRIKAGAFKERLRGIADTIAIGFVELLPQVLKRCQDSPSCLMQGVLMIHALPTHHLWLPFFKRLTAVGEGFTIEFISIKIWTAFEEAFQALHEGSEVRKLLASTPNGTSPFQPQQIKNIINMAHARFACASFTLKSVLEIVLWAYESQRISLLTVAKAARSALADSRKVIIRYQRMYTMWSTAIIGDSSNTEVSNDKFEARHALISLSLRHLVEITNKITRYSLAREEKFSQAAIYQARDQSSHVEEHWNEMLMMLDMQRPFADHEHGLQQLLLNLTDHPIIMESNEIESQVSLLHHDLRKLAFDGNISVPTFYKDRLLALATGDGWEEEVLRRKRKLVSVIYPGSRMFAERIEEAAEEAQLEVIPMPFASPSMSSSSAPGSVDRKPAMFAPPPPPPPMPPFQINKAAMASGIPPPPVPPAMSAAVVASLIPPPPMPPSRLPSMAPDVGSTAVPAPIPPQFAQTVQQPLHLDAGLMSRIQPQQQPTNYHGNMLTTATPYDQAQVAANENAANMWESYPMMTGTDSFTPTAAVMQQDFSYGNRFIDPQQMQTQPAAYEQSQHQPYMKQNNHQLNSNQQYHNNVDGLGNQAWDPKQQFQQPQQQYQQRSNQQQQPYQDRSQGRFGGRVGGEQGFGGRGRGGRGRGGRDQWQDGGRSGRGGRGRGEYDGSHNNKFQRKDDTSSQSANHYGYQQQQEHQSQPWQQQEQQQSQQWQQPAVPQQLPVDPHQQFMIPMTGPSVQPASQFLMQQQQGQHPSSGHPGQGQQQAYRRS